MEIKSEELYNICDSLRIRYARISNKRIDSIESKYFYEEFETSNQRAKKILEEEHDIKNIRELRIGCEHPVTWHSLKLFYTNNESDIVRVEPDN